LAAVPNLWTGGGACAAISISPDSRRLRPMAGRRVLVQGAQV